MENQKLCFLHFSDAHLGHLQYGVKKRRDDIYRTFRSTIKDSIDNNIDFAVFGGDLFHNKNVNARALDDAEKGLDIFYDNDIPVVGIQGNHDANLYTSDLNWLEYLHRREKLILLEANIFDKNSEIFEKHNFGKPGTSSGYVDIEDVRIFGFQYLGQRTEEFLEKISEEIKYINEEGEEPRLTVLLGHFGIEGHIPQMSGGISYNKLKQLEGVVDYLGLGHIHKNYEHKGWVFNPGSLEAHDARESRWKHGYYIVDITENGFRQKFKNSKRRPFYKIQFYVDNYESPEKLENGFIGKVEKELSELQKKQKNKKYMAQGEPRDPVVDLHLQGLLRFRRQKLDIDRLREIVEQKTNAIYVNIKDATESRETSSILEDLDKEKGEITNEDGQIDRKKLEFAVFQKLVSQNSRYNSKTEDVADILSMLKKSVLSDESPELIAETVKKRRRELFTLDSDDR